MTGMLSMFKGCQSKSGLFSVRLTQYTTLSVFDISERKKRLCVSGFNYVDHTRGLRWFWQRCLRIVHGRPSLFNRWVNSPYHHRCWQRTKHSKQTGKYLHEEPLVSLE